jgi:hypothetical protein
MQYALIGWNKKLQSCRCSCGSPWGDVIFPNHPIRHDLRRVKMLDLIKHIKRSASEIRQKNEYTKPSKGLGRGAMKKKRGKLATNTNTLTIVAVTVAGWLINILLMLGDAHLRLHTINSHRHSCRKSVRERYNQQKASSCL